jgi:MAP3K TRAFs-binding domain
MLEPIAFVVMPFDKKATGQTESGVPVEVDFDALWQRVYFPVLTRLGYQAVRADRDVGALIISEMIQRLALADLVVADVTLPNANVYYEVGIRHAAKRVGCVLIAADWAQPLFDLRQMRQLRFPLSDGAIGDETAKAAVDVLTTKLGDLIDGTSPVFDAVDGFPEVDLTRASAFREVVAQLSDFDADVRATRLAPADERKARALEVFERHKGKKAIREAVVLELLRLLRDLVGWQEMLDYIETLPPSLSRHPLVAEQRSLALGKLGDPAAAAAQLEQLIKGQGKTAERLGLLGGRYKELYRARKANADGRRYLDWAIESYEEGMFLDLNGYYASSNLPRLYRERGSDGDEERAEQAQLVTMRACERAIKLGVADEWARPTLLGLAFARGDVVEAERVLGEVQREGADAWKLATTISDLETDVANQADDGIRDGLRKVLDALTELLAAYSEPQRAAGD